MKVSDKEYVLLRTYQQLRDDVADIKSLLISSEPTSPNDTLIQEIKTETAKDIISKIWSSTWYHTIIENPKLYRELDRALRDIAKEYKLDNIF